MTPEQRRAYRDYHKARIRWLVERNSEQAKQIVEAEFWRLLDRNEMGPRARQDGGSQ